MKIYLAHPISGLGYDEVCNYYTDLKRILEGYGYEVLQPMTGKGYLRNEIEFRHVGYDNPPSTNHAIVGRDTWMVRQADVVLVDFTGAKEVSIGCTSELAMAHALGKHTIIVLEPDPPGARNIHRHAFILEEANIIYEDIRDAVDYLHKLSLGNF